MRLRYLLLLGHRIRESLFGCIHLPLSLVEIQRALCWEPEDWTRCPPHESDAVGWLSGGPGRAPGGSARRPYSATPEPQVRRYRRRGRVYMAQLSAADRA
jgi:hypothetical protein